MRGARNAHVQLPGQRHPQLGLLGRAVESMKPDICGRWADGQAREIAEASAICSGVGRTPV